MRKTALTLLMIMTPIKTTTTKMRMVMTMLLDEKDPRVPRQCIAFPHLGTSTTDRFKLRLWHDYGNEDDLGDNFDDIGDGFGVDDDNDNERNCHDILSDQALTKEGPWLMILLTTYMWNWWNKTFDTQSLVLKRLQWSENLTLSIPTVGVAAAAIWIDGINVS